MNNLFRSTGFRIALIFSLLVLLSTLMIVGLLWWRAGNYLDREIDAVILADARAIGDELRNFGVAGACGTGCLYGHKVTVAG